MNMSLLPKSSNEFSSEDYWNKFFSKRGAKAFEWYGEYTELCGYLHKYIKPNDKILVAGCGNSTLSADMYYKSNFKQITNIDISEIVIKQMKAKYNVARNENQEENTKCAEMKWIQGDLFDTKFESESFSCILDKGTLDALMSGEAEKAQTDAVKYFEELGRILRIGGRYVCISLLQDHILSALLNWFTNHGWFLRFCRCEDAESSQAKNGKFSLPVFIIVCTKLKPNINFKSVIELNMQEDQILRVDSEKVKQSVKSLQQFAMVKHNLKNKGMAGEDVKLELVDQKEGKTRFTLFIIDSPKVSNKLPFAVFIVPHGRETEYLFKNKKGQLQLAEEASVNRLVVVHLMREQSYGSMKEVQQELAANIADLAPSKLPKNYKIPCLSVGDDLGERKELYRGRSKFSGDYIVEDVKTTGGNSYLRRLIFLKNQNLIQSEAKLIYDKRKGKNKARGEHRLIIDPSYLVCAHHAIMLISFQFTSHAASSLLIGLGGGALASYIRNYFPKASLVVVDIDEEVVNVAKNWFNFKMDTKLKCEVDDGIHFVERAASTGTLYDVIMFDIDSKEVGEGLSCPPKQFVEKTFLEKVSKCLSENGLFTLNLVCRDRELKERVIEDLKVIFSSVYCVSVPEEVNVVLFCQRSTGSQISENHFKEKVVDLNRYLKFQTKNNKDDVLEIEDMLSNFEIL